MYVSLLIIYVMGGEGSMMAAIQSLRNNRNLLSKRQGKKVDYGSYANVKLKNFPKASASELFVSKW